ncbi:MAG: hypothetical protein QOJ16_4259 [Acidobacteriota bacterium]|jgi:ELWxxDGT repeat protein|nr:hypothetical protein [Acidobacteriota bacterium]
MKKVCLFLALLPLLATAAPGTAGPAPEATAALVRDLRQEGTDGTAAGFRSLFTALGKLFFLTSAPGGDTHLWVSDGTAAGTDLLPNGCDDACYPQFQGFANGVSFFSSAGRLWRSDGTRPGTYPLTEPSVRFASSVVSGGRLFFNGCTATGCRLWTSDGTVAATRPVLPLSVAGTPTAPSLAALRGAVYYATRVDSLHSALWKSDGTAAGTTVVASFSDRDKPLFLTSTTERLFFFGSDERQVWTSDGTAAGTVPLTQFTAQFPFAGRSVVYEFTTIGSRFYFAADADGTHGLALWQSDGTLAGTRRIGDVGPGADIMATTIEEIGGRVVFGARQGEDLYRLRATDGTPSSTSLLTSASFLFNQSARVGGRIVFNAMDSEHGRELWTTDGTAAGTHLLRDLCPGPCSPQLAPPALLLGAAFFAASTPTRGAALWRTDGTPAGTQPFVDLPALDEGAFPAALGDRVFYVRRSADGREELWASDGTPGGTRPVFSLLPDAPSADPQELVPLAGRLFFTATGDSTGAQVWQSDGTAAGTAPVTPGTRLTPAAGLLFFLQEDAQQNVHLARTDGTAAGTLTLADLAPERNPTLLPYQGRLLFDRFQRSPAEVWQSDGTPAGTRLAFSLPPQLMSPQSLQAAGDDLFILSFSGEIWHSDGSTAGTTRILGPTVADRLVPLKVGSALLLVLPQALYRTDGTAAGTTLLSPTDLSGLTDPVVFRGATYFFATQAEGRALWRSDGTAAGTTKVLAFPGETTDLFHLQPAGLTVAAVRLFFAADDGVHGRELWASDGTAAGTVLVSDIEPGPDSSRPTGLTAAGGRLFFSTYDGRHGRELWESDGTGGGTRLVQDIAPASFSSVPQNLTVAGDRLYFSADDGLHGRELWALPLSGPAGCRPGGTRLCLAGSRFQVEIEWRDFAGHTGVGHAVSLTADTGYFWFFDPANVETVVKVLDARALNQSFWVFYGALSSVEYALTVTDTQTGLSRRYVNPSGQLASVGDTNGFGPLGAAASKTAVAKASPLPLVAARTDTRVAIGSCVPSPGQLCLNGGRFAVTAAWKDFQGRTGTGTAVSLTADTGYFWFFAPTNVEVVTKVLDGRGLNGKFWLFYGALSNVEYTLTVTDTETGAVRTYKNPLGQFGSVADTGAF